MYQIAICDDEIMELDKVEQMLIDYNSTIVEVELQIRRFMTADELFIQITTCDYRPDIIFMDIYMPGKSGIEMAKELRDNGNDCKIVFLSSSQEHALEAFGVEAFSYLVKPVFKEKLFPVLNKLIKELASELPQYVILQTEDCVRRIELNDIVYCEAQRKKQYIYLRDGEAIFLRLTMAKLFELLCVHKKFFKLGVSYIINLEHVESLSPQILRMNSAKEIYLPRGSYKELRERYFDYNFRIAVGSQ